MADDDWETDPDHKFTPLEKSESIVFSKPSTQGVSPSPRHSCAISSLDHFVYLFGGTAKTDVFQDFFVLDTKSWLWKEIKDSKGEKPGPLWGMSLTTIGRKLYLFGGEDINGMKCELFVYNIDSNTWTKPSQTGAAPSPRSMHSAAISKDNLLIFGGVPGDASLYILTPKMEWFRTNFPGGFDIAKKEASMLLQDRTLVLFGGLALDRMQYMNDLWTLDLDQKIWKKQVPKGVSIPPLASHTSQIVSKNLIIVGGRTSKGLIEDVYLLELSSFNWIKVKGSGTLPSPRFHHSSTTIPGDKIIIFGGRFNENNFTNELFVLAI